MNESEIAPNSKLNALKHGLTARQVVLPGESPTLYEAFEARMTAELQPAGVVEELLAHRVAACAWRLLRVERLEGALASSTVRALVEAAGVEMPRPKGGGWVLPEAHAYDGLAKLARHEAAIERSMFRCLRELRDRQDARMVGRQAPEA